MAEKKDKLALVLAGGGALGAYEVGAVEALNDLGFEFDIITGCSIGALNAAFITSKQFDKMKEVWLKISASNIYEGGLSFSNETIARNKYNYTIDDYLNVALSYVKHNFSFNIGPFKELIKENLDIDALKKSNIKCGVVTTKFMGLKEVDILLNDSKDEEILPYLHASSACVPFFPFEVIDNNRYMDGFFSDNLPIKFAFNLGATKVIAIDLLYFQLSKEHKTYLMSSDVDYIAPLRPLGSFLNFEQSGIRRNMTRGYYDVMKHYGKFSGFYYTFEGKMPSHNFFSILADNFRFDISKIVDLLTEGLPENKSQLNDNELFVRCLEIVLDETGFGDETIIYNYQMVKTSVHNAVLTAFKDSGRDKLNDRVTKHLFKHRRLGLNRPLRQKIALFMIERYLWEKEPVIKDPIKKIGLVLAGGGSLGSYQVGALQALNELGFKYDIVTGSSIGVLNGALIASNQFDDLRDIWRNLTAKNVYDCGMSLSKEQILHNKYNYTFKDIMKLTGSFYRHGLCFDSTPLMNIFEEKLDVDKLFASDIDFVFPVTRFKNYKEVDINVKKDATKENVMSYLKATSACFPLVKPIKINKKRYIDSFYANRLPLNLVQALGANYFIMIDLRFWEKKRIVRKYYNYDNLEFISPYRKLGSIIDYEVSTLKDHEIRGYYDVLKHFKKLKGFIYTFKGEMPYENSLKLLQHHFRHSLRILRILNYGMRYRVMNDEDYFIRMLEITFEELGINEDTKIYDYDEAKSLIKKKVEAKKDRSNFIKYFAFFAHRRAHRNPHLRKLISLYFINYYILEKI